MSNMGYCRFTNTLEDLRDCYNNMADVEELSEIEVISRRKLIVLSKMIVKEYGHEARIFLETGN